MLASLGDLVDDIVVRVGDPLNVASDTVARIDRRRGGSAANVAEAAARIGAPARFLGQVGDDAIGVALVAELAATGVDTSCVRRRGRTGTIVVLVDPTGERSMLTDRGACPLLDEPDPSWLDGVTTLHVPLYSLVGEPLASTARTLVGWCHESLVPVSIDVSSVALIESTGADAVTRWLDDLRPSVVFANADEAVALAIEAPVAGAVTVVKRGSHPAVVFAGGTRHDVPTEPMVAADTTGAGDAFAAGFLLSDWRRDVRAACHAGHRSARRLITSLGRPVESTAG